MSGGGTKINPTYIAVWGGMLSTGQFVGVGLLQFVTDKLGRKRAMHLTWLCLVVVSFDEPGTNRLSTYDTCAYGGLLSLCPLSRPLRTGCTGSLPDSWAAPASG